MKNNKSFADKIVFNNKLLLLSSVLLSIIVWTIIQINYSDSTVRTISDIKFSITNEMIETNDIIPFFDEKDLYCDVEIKGKSYNINSYALQKEDIVVEASGAYIDSAGYKVLTLSAKTLTNSNVEFTKITPSTITVYFDKKDTQSFNVEAKLDRELNDLVEGNYIAGSPVPSIKTVDITGPATILNKLNKVYFEAQIKEDKLQLTKSKDFPAKINYDLERDNESKYLVCENINEETNPATVTVPIYISKEIPVGVKFINQPAAYEDKVDNITISPSKIKILYNPADENILDTLYIGTIDFSKLSNKVNEFEFKLDDKLNLILQDTNVSNFKVSIDMSKMSSKKIEKTPFKIVFLNQAKECKYTIDYEKSPFDEIVIIGPKESLDKITPENIQMEINVSSLDVKKSSAQKIKISNISIQSEEIKDCWIYGEYTATVSVTEQNN